MNKHLFSLLALLLLVNPFANAQYGRTDDPIRKLGAMMTIIDQAYVDSVDSDMLAEEAIKAMLKKLDPHSVYISKKDLQKMNEPLVGEFDGIGVQFSIHKDTITVISPISDGPSEKLGIRSGDRFIKIDGEVVAGIGIKNQGVMDRLRGKKGTQVTVHMKRRGEKKLIEFTITRDKIPIYSVDASYMARPGIGYIKVNRFARKTTQELLAGMEKLKKKGMKSLILDLRGNGGGYLDRAFEMADQFLPTQKLIVYTEGLSSRRKDFMATVSGSFEKGKVVILVDEGSASASEIVSGAVQDWDRGLIIGRRTFGKGLVQKPFPLPDGSAVRLTTARYYTPTGRSIQKPYEDGFKDYYNDVYNRYKHGELSNQDSIKMPDSLQYKTPAGRTVYGGGGIMPDIFVPLDTTLNTEYYTNLLRKGVINEFSLSYMDKHREELKKKYKNIDKFIEGYTLEAQTLAEFYVFAEKKGVEKNEEEMKISQERLTTVLTALIARGIWKIEAYHQIVNELSPSYQKAIEVLQDDTFKKLNIK